MAMETKHTQGPWRVSYNGSYGPFVDASEFDKTGYGAAHHDIGIETHSICAPGGPNARANANLIAAAPELLTILERFYAQTYGEDINGRISLLDFEQARKAIDKARGRV